MASPDLYLELYNYPPSELPHPEIAQIFTADVLAALASARIVRRYFNDVPQERLHVEYKGDETPKTIADTEGDYAIYERIRKLRPFDNMLLEESAYHKGLTDLHPVHPTTIRHYADSLDGSRPFIEKKPWSTVGVMSTEEGGDYLTGVIVHPFRQCMAVAVRGLGAYLIPLNARMLPTGEQPQPIHVSTKETLAGGTVSIDSLFPIKNKPMREMKHSLMKDLEDMGITSYDMVGSNIAYQLDVALGRSILGFTDAMGGPWDWRVGEALVTEAGGLMLDIQTGEKPTDQSQAVVYGNEAVVNSAYMIAQFRYQEFEGFNILNGVKL